MSLIARRDPTRRLLLALALVLGLVISPLGATAPAHADSGMESSFVSQLNAARASNGLPALSVNGSLTSVARSWSKTMADEGKLYHNPSLGSQVSGWKKVGENVGRGPSVNSIHAAFMASPGHKRNILDPDWTEVGVGVVVKDGTVWVTQVFRLPAGQSKPAPEPEPEPEPKPEAEPEPKSEPTSPPKPAASSSPKPASSSSAPAPSPEPEPEPKPEPEPTPEPHEVTERPLGLDRITLTLASMSATDLDVSLDVVLNGSVEDR